MTAAPKESEDIDRVVDYRKVSTKVAQHAVDRLIEFAETKLKQNWAKYRNYTRAEFARYMRAQGVRCGLVRTLIYNNQSAHLPDIYVPLRVRLYRGAGHSQQSHDADTSEVIDLLLQERDEKVYRLTFAGAVSGPAGAGKSFLMRHLYLELMKRESSRVPVFIEARELNSVPPLDFPNVIVKAFEVSGCKLSVEQASEGLKSGIFCILIDGFDELRISRERHYAKELDRAAEKYQACPILVSGRPSELLLSSNHFENCELLPLTLHQSLDLIEKLAFDGATKKSFIALVKRDLWTTHREFLEIPLLCVVLLITYSDAGRVSRHQHEFYEDAYFALWSKHDARKQAGFEREKYTKLDKQEFLKLVSAFCASSYISEDFLMGERGLISHLAKAKQLTGIPVEESAFVKDMTVSTSLLVFDGGHYKFSHRSFQEFLCANYVLELGDEDVGRGIEAISSRYATDNVLAFVKSMNAERFEIAWVIPRLASMVGRIASAKSGWRAYKALVDGTDGQFMMKLRAIYELRPTNEQISAAIDAQMHMGQATAKDLSRLGSGQMKLFLRDADNFLALHAKLQTRYKKRAGILSALFRDGGEKPSES